MERDIGLDTLLSLDGESFHDESGYWWKISVRRVKPSPEKPHGLDYELTLHDRFNRRVMGFDNAHAAQNNARGKKLGKYRGRITTWDHVHSSINDAGSAYAFSSAQQLLEDFLKEVNKIIDGAGE